LVEEYAHGLRYGAGSIRIYVEGKLWPGISIRETIICKPLYFGQKDLSAAGKGFGHDLVEKLVGDGLADIRETIEEETNTLRSAIEELLSIHGDAEDKQIAEAELKDVKFRLEQFDKYGVKDKLEKQVEFNNDTEFCEVADEYVEAWRSSLEVAINEAKENFKSIAPYTSKHNAALFEKYDAKLKEINVTVADAAKVGQSIKTIQADLKEAERRT
jgi:chromosome segregation protein